jgi:parallel beta-helix repeat protein
VSGGANTLTNNSAANDSGGFEIFSDSNTLKGNVASNNLTSGFVLEGSDMNVLSGNTANGNGSTGIFLMDSNNNTITGNTFKNNGGAGIHADHNSDQNTFTSNTATGNGFTAGTFDLEDDTSGGSGTAGTKNTWHKNKATTANPIALLTA